jgi:hypothetical protein
MRRASPQSCDERDKGRPEVSFGDESGPEVTGDGNEDGDEDEDEDEDEDGQ